MRAYRTLGIFPEVRGALERLGERRPLAILSNGHPDMLDAVVDHNELRVFFGERVLSVHEAGVFKPDPRVYAIADRAARAAGARRSGSSRRTGGTPRARSPSASAPSG